MSIEDEKQRSRGLGRGLSALLGEGEEAEAALYEAPTRPAGETPNGVRILPIELLEPNPDQPRKVFKDSDLEELSESIAEKGMLQPILVRPIKGKDERFQIVAGERRWRAAQKARLHEAPCIIRELTDRETLEIAIVENVQRADLNPVEEARALRQLVENFGHTQEDIAKAVGKSRSHVANMLRLLVLPKGVLARLDAGEISAGHARAIATSPDPDALCEKIIAEGLSVRAAEALAREAVDRPKKSSTNSGMTGQTKDADTRALESDLSHRLGLGVEINHKSGEKGAVTIQYKSLDQLDEICRRLSQSTSQ